MKLAKKIATMLMCVCLVVPCFSMMVQAATEGVITVGNATAKAGEEVKVSLSAKVDAGIGNRTITITYDSQLLEFVSGAGVSKVSDGELKYESTEGINSLYSGKELTAITFKALGAGTATVKVKGYDVKSSFEISWTCHDGSVSISGGTSTSTTPSTDVTDEPVDQPSEEPTEEPTEEPAVDAEVVISNSTTISLITDVSHVILPERYAETTVTMDGYEYPAWQDTENTDMYILYAYSSNGIESLYQYDTLENTYQRFEAPEVQEVQKTSDNWLEIFGDKANYVLIGAGALLVLFIIIVIVLSVKLYNRDAELDEVYDDLDKALAEKEALKGVKAELTHKAPEVETEDDVLFTANEEVEEDDSEVEVEFYVEESINEYFEEEQTPVVEKAAPVQKAEEYYDDDDDFYDDIDGDFSVSFIDLD